MVIMLFCFSVVMVILLFCFSVVMLLLRHMKQLVEQILKCLKNGGGAVNQKLLSKQNQKNHCKSYYIILLTATGKVGRV
jgi:uncharacterized membrane protein YpjA